MHLQRNHSRTKVSRFKAGRATSSLSREFTVKIAYRRRYARCVHISRGRSSLCMRRSSISSVNVSSHSMIQVPCTTPRIPTSTAKRSIIEGACMRYRLGFRTAWIQISEDILMEGNIDTFASDIFPYWTIDVSYVIYILDNSVINSENVRDFHFLVEHAFSRSLICKYMI